MFVSYVHKTNMTASFIVFEGIDRSGKTTQSSRLVEYLNQSGRPAVLLRFPNRTTPIGNLINSYLGNKMDMCNESIHLLFSANRWEMCSIIRDHLENGITVVADRYTYSGVAFSMAKGMDMEWCLQSDKGMPVPDLVLFMRIADTSDRPGWGGERYETKDFQERVRTAFSYLHDARWCVVNASKSVDEVELSIRKVVNKLLVRYLY